MRERLLAAFLSLTLLTVMLYGVPRAVVRADIVNAESQREVDRAAAAAAEVVGTRLQAGLPAAGAQLAFVRRGDQVLLRTASGTEVLAGPPRASEQIGDSLVAEASVVSGGTVQVLRARDVVRGDVVRAIRPIILTGMVALVVAAVAGVLLASRLSRPFQLLARRASTLGSGDFDVDLPPQKVREAESIAAALRRSSASLRRMIEREREFGRNASHQLRTPLTGMRLRVEDVTTWPETPASVREELSQVLSEIDRLSDTVTSLLAFAREEEMTAWQQVSLDAVVDATIDRWRALAGTLDRPVHGQAPRTTPVPLSRIAVDQVLDVLVDNALKHGRGSVSVSAAADELAVRFVVADEGGPLAPGAREQLFRRRRRQADDAPGGEGIGLSLCADLAQSFGGRLRLAEGAPTTFELLVPVARRGPDG